MPLARKADTRAAAVADDVRSAILAAATRLFAERGFGATAVQDVADAVGIRKPSLLYHFASKDELRRAVLDSLLSRWKDVLPRLLLAASSGEDRFDLVLAETVAFFTVDPDRARLLVREVLDRPREMGALLSANVTPWVSMVSKYIRKGQEEGRIYAEVDPEAYVVEVINLVVSGVATFECIGALAETGAREANNNKAPASKKTGARRPGPELLARHVGELLRVAKSSLFKPEHESAPPASKRSAEKKSAATGSDEQQPPFKWHTNGKTKRKR